VFQVIRALGIPRSMSSNVNTSYGQLFGGGDDWKAGAPMNVGMNAMADTLEYMGVKIVKTNHLPDQKDLSATSYFIGSDKYNLNCSAFSTFGVIFQTQAIAGLSLQGMKVDTVQDVRRNTQFTVASMMKGTGVIRPETCKALIQHATYATRASLYTAMNTGTNNTTPLGSGFGAEYAVTS
jgi:hypothetical protein